jgi:heavy metal efflux system protein
MNDKFFRSLFRHRAAILLIVLFLSMVGFQLLGRIPQGVFPNVFFPRIQVTFAQGYTPIQQMLFQVTRPAEETLKTIQGVEKIVSNTSTGLTEINLYFNWNSDPHFVYQLVQSRLADLRNHLPAEVQTTVIQATPSRYPVAILALTSQEHSRQALSEQIYYHLRPYLLSTPGIYDIQITAPEWQEYQIVLNSEKLTQFGLRAEDIANFLKEQNKIQFLGLINQFQKQYIISLSQKPADMKDLLALEVPTQGHERLQLKDLALTIKGTPPKMEYTAVSDAAQSVTFTILRQPDADSVAVKEALNQRMVELNRKLKLKHMALREYYDETAFIHESVNGVRDAVILGTLIITLIVFLFLRKLKLALFLLVVVPLIFLITAIGIKGAGLDLNIFSLGGLAASVGGLIDHLIIVIEAIEKEYQSGKTRLQAVIDGSREILPLMSAATLISILLFLPLLLVSGVVGIFFKQLAFVIVITYVLSQIFAIFFTPLIAYIALPEKTEAAHQDWFDQLLNPLLKRLKYLLSGWRPWLSLPISLLLLGLGLFLYSHMTSTFLPQWDEGAFVVDVALPPGSSLAQTKAETAQIGAIISAHPAVAHWSLRIGSSLGSVSAPANIAEFVVALKTERKESVLSVQEAIKSQVDARFQNLEEFDAPQILEDRLADILGQEAPISVLLYGPDPLHLIQAGKKVRDALRQESDLLEEVNLKTSYTSPEIVIKVNSDSQRKYGLSTAQITEHLNTLFFGQVTGDLIQGEKLLNIRLKTDQSSQILPASIQKLTVFSPLLGHSVPLSELVTVNEQVLIPEVTHHNLSPVAVITVRFKGDNMSGAVARVKKVVAESQLPEDITPEITGFYQEQQQSFREMLMVVGFAVMIIFISLLLQFSDIKVVGVILVGLLLSLSGSLLALYITGRSLDITAFMGILIVLSIVINNNILIFDYYQRYQSEFNDPASALLRALQERFRPIVMTMVANICALLPIALAWGAGTQLIQNMAIAIMGGLGIALLISLLLVPQLFCLLQKKKPL